MPVDTIWGPEAGPGECFRCLGRGYLVDRIKNRVIVCFDDHHRQEEPENTCKRFPSSQTPSANPSS